MPANIFINRLSKIDLWKLPEGRHEDGLGLSLLVGKGAPEGGGSRSWVLRAKDTSGVQINRGLGPLRKINLEQARQRRDALLVLAAQAPEEPMPSAPLLPRKMPTFLERAKEVIPVQTEGCKSPRAVYHWERSLLHFAKALHDKPINTITSADVVAVLAPIWLTKKSTAKAARKHIAKVFSSAIADELIDRNPAAMEDNLEHKLRKQKHKTRNHPAMPYADVPAYLATLEAEGTMGALALAFTILTAVRSAEAFTARWSDIDKNNVWKVPGKNSLFARVPLSAKAQDIVRKARELAAKTGHRGDPATYVFPGLQDGHISNHTMLKLLQTTHPELTVHGFRASFKSWGKDLTSIEHDTLEYCLHHIEGSRTEQAYMRAECLEKRRVALEQWAAFCAPAKSDLRLVA
jgi:integrase